MFSSAVKESRISSSELRNLMYNMTPKILCLLILCGILCPHQTLAEELSDNLVRRKRVINLEVGGDVPLKNGEVPYVANIRKTVGHLAICVGVIMSKHTVMTSASCVMSYNVSAIEVLVGSSYNHQGTRHGIVMKNVHIGNHQRGNTDGIAMLTVEPAIIFDTKTSVIQLYQGPLQPGMQATVSGWGFKQARPTGTDYRARLRLIIVPILNHAECVNIYRGRLSISNNDICTYHQNRRCGHTDAGAPLVVHNRLAGIHLLRSETSGYALPDVFLNLQSSEYASWIRSNIIYNVVHLRGAH